MRIAVASKSGTQVDQHFGHAERFWVYQVDQESSHLVAEVPVEKYCSFDPEHAFRHGQFHAIVAALAGCSAVVTAMIGEYPRQELEKAGLRSFADSGPIEQVLARAAAVLREKPPAGLVAEVPLPPKN